MLLTTTFTPAANAATFDQQIKQLQQNSAQAENNKQQLGHEAANLSETIAALQAEIASLDDQIGQTNGHIDQLNKDIVKAENELTQQRKLLHANVRQMYTDQDTSTLEMLASSKNFSHFLDREHYRENVQEKIDATTKRIEKLNTDLTNEKKSVENTLADQQAMQAHVTDRRAENARLLGLNQEQQLVFQNTLNANQAEIAKLRQQQTADNNKGVVSKPAAQQPQVSVAAPHQAADGSAYPWANVPFPNSLPDPWGMFKRQCVSYTAWKVASSGRHMPFWGGRGNAKQWDDNAIAAGIPTDGNPRVGDVAISNAGAYGHAMYVEAVHGDGTITVSQYNADWQGHYSVARRSAANLSFIHF